MNREHGLYESVIILFRKVRCKLGLHHYVQYRHLRSGAYLFRGKVCKHCGLSQEKHRL